jgi:glycosyltransferase involved in cell wall biosynthesis
MPRVCLNMIVKNEAERITRALDSVAQFIDCYVITDTGSTDDTEKVITDYFAAHQIPGHVTHAPFNDWGQARSEALIQARRQQAKYQWDWLLLMDADMALVMKDHPAWIKALEQGRPGMSLDMEQRCGQLHYLNRRLVHKDATGLYKGVTHEYLDVDTAGEVSNKVAYFDDFADGANRPDKYKRDIRLLLKGLKAEPDNSRYYFYLAQSYRDAGLFDKAIKWYERRVEAGGWDEERWNAQVNLAHCYNAKGDEAKFVHAMLKAYNMRPSRAESLFDLAHHFRNQDSSQNIAALFAEVGMTIPRTKDGLFVADYVYEGGLANEFAITAFYSEHKRRKGFEVASALSIKPGPYPVPRETARHNLYHYMPLLPDIAKSFTSHPIPLVCEDGWTPLNPSIANIGPDAKLQCIVRTVNYRIDEHGAYWVGDRPLGHDPIVTRNFLVGINDDLGMMPYPLEIKAPADMPCEFPPVIGFEDMRLFEHDGRMLTSSTVRQIHPDGNCEQVLAALDPVTAAVTEYKRMLREPRETQKNWAPIPEFCQFMYRPGHVVDTNGATVVDYKHDLSWDIISGGSQVIKFGPGNLALVHTAQHKPGSSKRYYYHRWAFYDDKFRLGALSLPFCIHDKQIEFVAGLAYHPTEKGTLVFSYGVDDREARIGTISHDDVMRMLWAPSKL